MSEIGTTGLPAASLAPADAEAHAFAKTLVDKYHKQRVATPHLITICIDFMGDYPEDALLERAIEILSWRWHLEPRQFEAAGCRAGCIWMTQKAPRS